MFADKCQNQINRIEKLFTEYVTCRRPNRAPNIFVFKCVKMEVAKIAKGKGETLDD